MKMSTAQNESMPEAGDFLQEPHALNNGVSIPSIGVGTWREQDGPESRAAVKNAIAAGYRLIDTAEDYYNESGVGRGVLDGMKHRHLSREEIFLQTKLPSRVKTYDGTLRHFDLQLQRLGVDYVDSYLIHAPWPWTDANADYDEANRQVWHAMQEIYRSGRARSIGVSNFGPHGLLNIMEDDKTEVLPAINQIECHPGILPTTTIKLCRRNGVIVQGYSPLGNGMLLNDPKVCSVADALTASLQSGASTDSPVAAVHPAASSPALPTSPASVDSADRSADSATDRPSGRPAGRSAQRNAESSKTPDEASKEPQDRVTPAQVCLRFVLDNGIIPIFKAAQVPHLLEDKHLNFRLTPEQNAYLAKTD